jgi:hypothetical protein
MDSRRIFALRRFPFSWGAEESPSAPTNVRLHERTAGCSMLAGLRRHHSDRRTTTAAYGDVLFRTLR